MTIASPERQRELLVGDLIIERDKRDKQESRAASLKAPRRPARGASLTGRGWVAAVVGVALIGTGMVVGSVELAQGGMAIVGLVAGALVVAWFRGRVTVRNLRTQPPMVPVGMPAQLTGQLGGRRDRSASGSFSLPIDTRERGD